MSFMSFMCAILKALTPKERMKSLAVMKLWEAKTMRSAFSADSRYICENESQLKGCIYCL